MRPRSDSGHRLEVDVVWRFGAGHQHRNGFVDPVGDCSSSSVGRLPPLIPVKVTHVRWLVWYPVLTWRIASRLPTR